MKNDLTAVNHRCFINKLHLNITKSAVVTYTRKKHFVEYIYRVNNIPLFRATEIKDLGVTFDNALSFNLHIDVVVTSCLKTLGFIFRTSKNFTYIRTFKTLFFSLIRSKLEYCCIVWCPYYQVTINRIESVQRIFLKYLFLLRNGHYPPQGIE